MPYYVGAGGRLVGFTKGGEVIGRGASNWMSREKGSHAMQVGTATAGGGSPAKGAPGHEVTPAKGQGGEGEMNKGSALVLFQ